MNKISTITNDALIEKVKTDFDRKSGYFLKKILSASADHGIFGMQLLDALHSTLPSTTCNNCGGCCNAVSIFSLEYHLIIRDLLTRLNPNQIRDIFKIIFRLDLRISEVGNENRVRCSFRDERTKNCLIHPVRPFSCRFFGMKKTDGSRDCPNVWEVTPCSPLSPEQISQLQTRIMENSESFEVYPGLPSIAFFPFDFWIFRFTLGTEKALEIYREVLVPSSTPLTQFWNNPELRMENFGPRLEKF